MLYNKRFLKFSILAIILSIVVVFSQKFLCIGSGCISIDDKVFEAQIRGKLKDKGDVVKVVDIHPGDWREVCVISGGNANAKYLLTDDINKFDAIKIRNSSSPYSTDKISVVMFVFSDDLIEVFRSKETDVSYGLSKSLVENKRGCLSKENAYFEVINQGQRELQEKKFHIDLRLTTEERG